MKIAIIGAGLAGLTLARGLSRDHQVTIFEKARGAGGRMSTRRADPYAFDHGAQYFTAETEEFRRFLEPYQEAGTVHAWPERIELLGGAQVSSKPKWTAAPGMNAICKSLAAAQDLQTRFHVETLERRDGCWHLRGKDGQSSGPFGWVVSTAPAPQTQHLLPDAFSGQAALAEVNMAGCFALMLGFEALLDLPWTALKSGEPPVGWMAMNAQKPGRDAATSLLIQSSNDWAEAHLEDAPQMVTETLIKAASELSGLDLSSAPHKALHRWRYAATPRPTAVPFLKDDELQLAACGDWCLGTKVEAAFLSASALAAAFDAQHGA